MNDKRIPIVDAEPKHKKRSTSKGLPRSKHKHQYETVLLSTFFRHKVLNNGTDKVHEYRTPVKVCMICGRTDKTDNNPIYYTKKRVPHSSLCIYEKELSEKALKLPRWYKEDFLDKFAKPYNEEEISE